MEYSPPLPELNVLSGIDPLLSATELSLLVGRTGTLLDSNNVSSYAVTSISAGSGLSSTGTGPGSLTINIGSPATAASAEPMTGIQARHPVLRTSPEWRLYQHAGDSRASMG